MGTQCPDLLGVQILEPKQDLAKVELAVGFLAVLGGPCDSASTLNWASGSICGRPCIGYIITIKGYKPTCEQLLSLQERLRRSMLGLGTCEAIAIAPTHKVAVVRIFGTPQTFFQGLLALGPSLGGEPVTYT